MSSLDFFNAGTYSQTPADAALQQAAVSQMTNYFRTELPALGFSLQQAKLGPAEEAIAAGAGAETGREAAAGGVSQARDSATARGISYGSGNTVAHITNALTRGAGIAGTGAAAGRSMAQTQVAQTKLNTINAGQSLQAQGMQGLESSAQTEDAAAYEQAQAKAAFSQAIGGLIGTAAGAAVAA